MTIDRTPGVHIDPVAMLDSFACNGCGRYSQPKDATPGPVKHQVRFQPNEHQSSTMRLCPACWDSLQTQIGTINPALRPADPSEEAAGLAADLAIRACRLLLATSPTRPHTTQDEMRRARELAKDAIATLEGRAS